MSQCTINKVLRIILSLVILLSTILAPMRQAQANAAGITVTATNWVAGGSAGSGMVEVTGVVGGLVRTASLIPKPPVVATAIIAGAGGAYVGDYLYKKYGSDVVDWAIDKTTGKVNVNLGGGGIYGLFAGGSATFNDVSSACDAAIAYRNSMHDGANYTGCVPTGSTTEGSTAAYLSYTYNNNNYQDMPAVMVLKPSKRNVQESVSDIASKAIADANTNANARQLVTSATADAATADDMTKDNSKPVDPATPFDPSSILSALQSLFSMLQGLLSNLLAAVQTLETALENILDEVKHFEDNLLKTLDKYWTEVKSWKDDFVKEYQDFRDWVYSKDYLDSKPEDGKIPVDEATPPDFQSPANASYVQFGGACPAPVQIPISYMGASTNLTISYDPFCKFASMIKPAVILSAYISALMIIAGGRSRE